MILLKKNYKGVKKNNRETRLEKNASKEDSKVKLISWD